MRSRMATFDKTFTNLSYLQKWALLPLTSATLLEHTLFEHTVQADRNIARV